MNNEIIDMGLMAAKVVALNDERARIAVGGVSLIRNTLQFSHFNNMVAEYSQLLEFIPISLLLFTKSYHSKKLILEYKKIQQNELQFLSLTGLSPAEFEELSADFSLEFEEYMSKYTFEGKERIRIFKPRKSSSLPTIEDKLFFILVFMKTNPLQEHHAASFGLTQPKANMS